MKAMLAGFGAMGVLSVAAWFLLTTTFDYTETQRAPGASVRLD